MPRPSWLKRLTTILQHNQRRPHRSTRTVRRPMLFAELLEQRDCPSAVNPDVLVVNGNTLSEYAPDGSLVQSFSVAYPGTRPTGESARGVVVGSSGVVSIFNGNASPYLSSFDPSSSAWTHTALTGASLDATAGYGEIGQYQNLVFVPNMASTSAGILVVDTSANTVSSVTTSAAYDNVTYGLDALVYATEAGTGIIDVFNPVSLNLLRSVSVSGSPLGLAVDAHGNIFTADASGAINEFNASGTLVNSWNPNAGSLTSIALAANGEVVAGSSTGNLVIANEAGAGFIVVPTNSSTTEAYVGFVAPQLSAPPINSAAATTFTVGTAGAFTVQSFGTPAPTFSATGTLPGGVTLTDNGNGTASLAGTPAAGTGGTYTFTIIAHNGVGADTQQSFTLTVREAPSITSVDATNFTVGTAGTFTVTTSNCFPAPASLVETGTLPGGVTFTDNGDGTATLTGTPATGSDGTYSLTITAHNGVGNDATQDFTLTVLKKTITTLNVYPRTEVFGRQLEITATVAPATGTARLGGTVTFFDNGSPLGTPVSLVNNRATFATTSLGAGTHALTAVYSGSAPYGASASAAVTETVNAAPTSVYLSTSSLAPRFGQTLTFTAHVIAGGFSTVLPAGSVAFMDGTTTLGSANVQNGYATFTAASLAIGTHPIQAVFTPASGNNEASSSRVLNETISKAFITLTLSATPGPSVAGQPVTLTASVTVVAPASADPSGTVTFHDGLTVLGTADVVDGVATLMTTALDTGIRTLRATYGGDGNVTGAMGITRMLVNAATTSVSVSAAPDTILTTQPFTLTASVTVAAPAVAAPSGTVSFFHNGLFYGRGTVNNGVATCVMTQRLAAGTYTFLAHYNGDLQCNGSSTTLDVVVNPIGQDADTVTLSSSSNPAPSNTPLTFTATVSAVDPSNGTPTGSVTFYNGKLLLGSATLDSNGVASLAPVKLPTGTFKITAAYGGDFSFQATTSAALSQTVILGTTTTLNVSSLAPYVGQPLTLSARVNPSSTSSVKPTGSITFYDGTTALGTVAVSNNTATLANQLLSVGAHQLTAVYTSDSTGVAGSTSPVITTTIKPAVTNTTLTMSASPIVYGQPVTLTASVTATNGSATPTGTVTFTEGLTQLGTATVVNGVATLTCNNIGTGTNVLTASYSGDSTTGASSGSAGLTVNQAVTSVDFSATPQYGTAGQTFTLTVHVNVAAPSTAMPTGTISVFNGAFLGTATVSNGVATFVTSTLGMGVYHYTVKYNGDGRCATSALSTCTFQMVSPPVVSSVTLASANSSDPGGTVSLAHGATVTATVVASDPQSFTLSYTYQWKVNGVLVHTDSGVSATSDTLDLASVPGGVAAGATITVVVTPYNGVLSGATTTSNTLNVTA